jgi:hypothetical protein
MMRKLMRVLPVLSLIGLLMAGCGPQEEPLEWEKIAQYDGGDIAPSPDERPRMTVVATPDQVSELEPYVYSFVLQEISQIDFSEFLVVAVFQGYHGVANYSVEVEKVTLKDRIITVNARFLEPDPNEVTVNITSSPYYVLGVQKTPGLHGEFTFVLIADGEEIMRQSRVIP